MLRPEFVRRKLQLIAEDLRQLLAFREATFEEVTGDALTLAAVERILERLVMRAIDVNQHLISERATGEEQRTTRLTYRDTFRMLADLDVYPEDFAERIAQSAGLRNILVHDYNDADRQIVYRSIRSCLEDYEQYVRHVDAFLEAQAPQP